MDKTEKIWLNGKLVDWEDAKVHVLAHALNYGTGVFEGIRVYHTPKGMAIFRLKDHVQRMMDGCKIMGIDLEFEGKTYGFDDICNAIKDVVRANGEAVDYVKPCIFLSGADSTRSEFPRPWPSPASTWATTSGPVPMPEQS